MDQLELMVDEVIREARRPVRSNIPEVADLCAVTRDRVAFWSVLADDQQRSLEVTVPAEPILVSAEARDLADALDALIGNVFAHTEEGIGFRVAVQPHAGPGAWLEVSDEGSGIADPEVLERGRSAAGSTGLGLDIARRVAHRAGGVIAVGASPGGGARIRLTLNTLSA
jgi:signal transduction histidine kinase